MARSGSADLDRRWVPGVRLGADGGCCQRPEQRRGAPFDVQPAGQDSLGGAAVVHALAHDRPQVPSSFSAELGFGAPDEFVGEHDVGDGHVLAAADLQELVGCGERVGQHGVVGHHAGPRPRRCRRRRSRPQSSRSSVRCRTAPARSRARKVMPFGWAGSDLRRCRTTSSSQLKSTRWSPASCSSASRAAAATWSSAVAVSTVSGSWPWRPRTTALSEPWPRPVAPREPNSSACTLRTWSSAARRS